jgi:selenocysteine-specific elongation factor SelB
VRHVVIGTAGHVDHGKTALVFALTEVHTDRLPEEQRRGITIELGFAPWRIADDVRVSVIDAPGHRKLVHHMIAGATGIDLVLLVVAADEGVMPQTREHIAACKLLGVERAVIAITKLDRVERDLAELAAEEALELLETEGIAASAVLCSAKSGEGVDDLRAEVLSVIRETDDSGDRAQRVRLSVDRVFTVKGAGTVVTGTLVSGSLSLGTPLRILGPERELKASTRGLHVHGETQEEAAAPTRLAINLACIEQGRPLVSGAAIRSEGQVTVIDSAAGTPCYHCIYPQVQADEDLSCSDSGVLAPMVGVIGCLQALEAVKLLANYGEPLRGQLLLIDGWSLQVQRITLQKNPQCPHCSPDRG